MQTGDLSASKITFKQAEVDRLRHFLCTTRNGVVYHEELAGPNGMSFMLILEEGVTQDMLKQAVHELRSDRDVVGFIRTAKIMG